MSFNYLKSFTRLMEKTEIPYRFQVWCGIASLLSVLERRVWVSQGIYNIYPNFFMILIAASGQKKSTPINMVDKLLRRVNKAGPGPNVVAQKVSPEALISAIKTREVNDSKALLKESCGGIVIADELATFLDRGALDRGLGPVLTKLFDCSTFEYTTLARGNEVVEGGYLSILGGTTVELLRSCLPRDAIGGGFTSRTLFVYEDKIAPPVPWVEYDESLMELEEDLVKYLSGLMELNGPIRVTADARSFYETDYCERYKNTAFRTDSTLSGYENRRQSHLFKIAMALMVAENPGLVLDEHHLRGAKIILEECEEYLPRVMDLINASDVGAQGNQIYNFIKSRGEVMRSELVRKFSNSMDASEISKCLDTLIQSQRIEVSTQGVKLVYRAK